MKRNSHFHLLFCLAFCFLIPMSSMFAEVLLFSWFYSDCYVQDIGSMPYFEEAYQKYPTIPIGMLEAVSFSYTRLESRVWPDTVSVQESDIPLTYSIMGLTLDGKGYFRENLRVVSALSGVREEDIMRDDRKAVMAYAAAFAALQRKYKCYGDKVEDYKQILVDLSEIPLQCEFALNSSLYAIYLFLADSNVVQYGVPRRVIDFQQVFGKWLPVLQQKSVLLGESPNLKQAETVDYPNAVWVPAASCNYSSRNGTQVTNITIHYTSGTYAGAIAWFQNCNARASAHYVIRSIDGQVTQMVRESDKAWHVGVANGYTIGIEHEAYGNIASFFTPVMYASSAALVRDICSRHPNINPLHTFYRDTLDGGTVLNSGLHSLGGSTACTRIRGHQHFPSQTHTDPGPCWNWNYYYKLINMFTQLDSTSDITGIFTDSGGQSGNYGNNERKLFLIHIPNADSIVLEFTAFDLEPDYDFMWIYEGNTVFAPLLGRWNTQSPGRVVAHGENMLVEFRSDCGTVASGWVAHWTGNSVQVDEASPVTRILADEENWKTSDFEVAFQDSDDVALRYQFFQVMECDHDVWSANPRTGFFCDNFDSTLSYTGWQQDGNWTVQNHALRNSGAQGANSCIITPLNGQSHPAYLFDFYLSMDSDTGDCTFIFHSDTIASTPSASFLAVTFSQTDNTLVIWKRTNGNTMELCRVHHVGYALNQKYLYRIVWDKESGRIMAFRHASLLAEMVLPEAVVWTGNYMGFMADQASVTIDNMRVYGARGDTVLITVGGSVNKMIRRQADHGVSTCKIKSIVMDNAGKFSALEEKTMKVDYTIPLPVRGVHAVFKTHLLGRNMREGDLQVSWGTASDGQSGIQQYYYLINIEQPTANLKIVRKANGLSTTCQEKMVIPNGCVLSVGVIAEDRAGLTSHAISTNVPVVF